MGVLRLFGALAQHLSRDSERATLASLDGLAAAYNDFAYIGNRKSLDKLVRDEAVQLRRRLDALRAKELTRLESYDASTVSLVKTVRSKNDLSLLIQEWLGKDWGKDSGVFPDFLLSSRGKMGLGDGALLELKDSKEASIASFNSTIPTRYKSLEDVKKITGSTLVSNAAKLYDFPFSLTSEFLKAQRSCFYLVRTRMKAASHVRISLVEGSFFETMPKNKLLQAIWGQLLDAAGLIGIERERTVELLSELEQNEIVQSREIIGASVRPRLRLMAEVHPDGNIHRYPEILPRTLNLVIKKEEYMNLNWLVQEFAREKISVQVEIDGQKQFILLDIDNQLLRLQILTILHKRNGELLVLQMMLD